MAAEQTGRVAIYVPLSPEAKAALREIAQRERRSPQDQAAVILERALRRTLDGSRDREAANAR